VDASDSYVVDVLNFVAHQFGGYYCFFGDWDVAGSRGDDYDHAFAVPFAIALEHDGSRQWTIFCAGRGGGYGGVLFFGGPRGEHVAAVGG
jgi:hypothetical protein